MKKENGSTYFSLLSVMRRIPLLIVVFALVAWQVPHRWAARHAPDWYASDPALVTGVSRSVQAWVQRDLKQSSFNTGDVRFDGEWLFGTYLMAGIGFCQEAMLFPDRREHLVPLIEECVEQVLSDEVKVFDISAWRTDPIETLDDPDQHHAAYLGYLNLLLSVYRQLEPKNRFVKINDRISDALAARMAASRIGLIQTYPQEVYPVDNCAVYSGVALRERLAPTIHGDMLARWKEHFVRDYVDKETGLLIQAVNFRDGEAIDDPRGSGTTLGLYALSFVEPEFSRQLFEATRDQLAGHFLGFGGVREYPRGVVGFGDIDSGPMVFGFGMSSTGFSIAGARIHKDRELFTDLFSTLYMCGAPLKRKGEIEYVSGGPLGNAIVFAMLTAVPTAGGIE